MNTKQKGLAILGVTSVMVIGLASAVSAFSLKTEDRPISQLQKTVMPVGTGLVKSTDQRGTRVAVLKNLLVKTVGTNSFTVDNNGTEVTVNIMNNTQLRRKFWGKSDFDEFAVGDRISVIGKWTDDTKTAINATLIRNESKQRRNGVFFGMVKSVTADGFVMSTIQRDDQTVTVGSAKLINRMGVAISMSDIKAGDKVRVRGLWDKTLKTVTEVTEVKDFDIPVRGSGSPRPKESVVGSSMPRPKSTSIPLVSPTPEVPPNP